MNKEVKFRLKRIISVSIFLIVATILWMDTNKVNGESLALYNDMNQLNFVELSNGVNLQNAYPVKDEQGLLNDSYNFAIVNNNNMNESYTIYFDNQLDDTVKQLPYSCIRYQVVKNNEIFISATTLNSDGVLFTDNVVTENDYELKFWINNSCGNEVMGSSFNAKVALK